jgi:hypothetical protein
VREYFKFLAFLLCFAGCEFLQSPEGMDLVKTLPETPEPITEDPPIQTDLPSSANCLNGQSSSITQFGITWTFDKKYACGRFVNGDYYIIDPGNGVRIQSTSPKSELGRNGSMINPLPFPNWGQVRHQAYDNRIANYAQIAGVEFPLTLNSDTSLVSTISLNSSDLHSSGSRYVASWQTRSQPGSSHVAIKTAAVLTILDKHPPAGSFRPPYVGDSKPLYNIAQIRSVYLPRLKAPSAAPSQPLSYFERGLERPWLLHGYDWQARKMHPLENMFNYHQGIGEFLSESSMILVSELATDTLLIRFLQMGIDTYHTMILGVADSAFFEWSVIYTGLVLGNEAMANAIKSGAIKTPGRATEKFYFWSDRTSPVARSSSTVEGKAWSGANVFFRKQIGIEEHEHLHPSEWAKATTSSVATNGGVKAEKYRQANDSHPHMGMLLSSRILSAQNRWRSHAPDAYLQRWMTENWAPHATVINQHWSGVPNRTRSMGSAFQNGMWELYKDYRIVP